MLIKIALNGGKRSAPSTTSEIAADIAVCAAAGASVFHIHPRDDEGRESLLAIHTDRVVRAIRGLSVSIGLTTGAWILPDPAKRVEAIASWSQLPDFASVNFDEDGCEDVARTLVRKGIGVEAGILDRASTERFLSASMPVVRVLIELQEQTMDEALRTMKIIEETLGDHDAPRLLHGHGAVAWDLFDEAMRRGYQTRIGLEDMDTHASNLEIWNAGLSRPPHAG